MATKINLPQEVAEKVLNDLQIVWDRVGKKQDYRDKCIQTLTELVAKTFLDKLVEEENEMRMLDEELIRQKSRITGLQRSLGVDALVILVEVDIIVLFCVGGCCRSFSSGAAGVSDETRVGFKLGMMVSW